MSGSPESTGLYQLHPATGGDIKAIIDYYLSQDSPSAAMRIVGAIFDMIRSLTPPEVRHRGHRRHDLTDRPLLFVSVYEYLIAYAPDDDPMLVLAVLHGRRNPRLLAAQLETRH